MKQAREQAVSRDENTGMTRKRGNMAARAKKVGGETNAPENTDTKSAGQQEELTLEQALQQLDEVMERLEGKDLPLTDAFHLYQQGMQLVKQCNDSIDKVEKQLIVLEEEGI